MIPTTNHEAIARSKDYRSENYLNKSERILFEGKVLANPVQPLFITQTIEESRLLKKNVLLGEVYNVLNDETTPIVGIYSNSHLDLYSIDSDFQLFEDIKNDILMKELSHTEDVIPGQIGDITDVINVLRKESDNSFHLSIKTDTSWKGTKVYTNEPEQPDLEMELTLYQK